MSVEVSSWVWRSARVDGTALLLLLAIADSANGGGEAWPSVGSLAGKARLSERQVKRLIKQLVGEGCLSVVSGAGRGRASRYVVKMEAADVTFSGPNGDIQGKGANRKGDVQGCALQGIEPLERNTGDSGSHISESSTSGRQEGVPVALAAFDEELRCCPGYDPDGRFYAKVLEKYGSLDLEEQAIRMRGWFEDPGHRRRMCSRGFVLGWLRRETQPAQSKAKPVGKGGGVRGRKRDLGGASGLERFG